MLTELPEIVQEFSTHSVAFDHAYLALDARMDNMIDFLDSKVDKV